MINNETETMLTKIVNDTWKEHEVLALSTSSTGVVSASSAVQFCYDLLLCLFADADQFICFNIDVS